MCAKVGGEVWSGVRRLRVYGSVRESPWLCWVGFVVRGCVGVAIVIGDCCRCESGGLVCCRRSHLHDSTRSFNFELSQNTTCPEHDTNLHRLHLKTTSCATSRLPLEINVNTATIQDSFAIII
jgi:hypothetical protein